MITTTDELAKIVDDVAADSTVFMYMPFTKFTGLLVSGGLWFGAQSNQIDVREPEPLLPSLSIGQHLEPSIHVRRYLAAMTCVGCWTLDDVLSDTMWRAYASTNGIAIQSTVRRLKQCFGSLDRASFGPVVYADGQQGMKDRRFRRELEYRVAFRPKQSGKGSLIECNLNELIETIWVSSLGTTSHFREHIGKLVQKFGVTSPVKIDDYYLTKHVAATNFFEGRFTRQLP